MSCRLFEGRVATASESLRKRRDDILRAIEEYKSKKITRRIGGLLFKDNLLSLGTDDFFFVVSTTSLANSVRNG